MLYYIGKENEFIKGRVNLLTEEKVLNILKDLEDPFLHKSLEETNGVVEIKIKPEKSHVSVKLEIAKTGTPEQMQLQMQVVNLLKEAGADSVGIRFAELSEEKLEKHRESIPEDNLGLLSPNSKTNKSVRSYDQSIYVLTRVIIVIDIAIILFITLL